MLFTAWRFTIGVDSVNRNIVISYIILGSVVLIIILLVVSFSDLSAFSQIDTTANPQELPTPEISITNVIDQTEVKSPIIDQANAISLPFVSGSDREGAPWGVTYEKVEPIGGLDIMSQAGAQWIRRDLRWSKVESTMGERNWEAISSFDNDIKNALSRDNEFIAIIGDTPQWALQTGFTCGQVAPEYFSILADFAYDAVKRYSVAPFNVKYWELWNEPDAAGVLGCWGDRSDPNYYGGEAYGEMIKVVYPRMKEANPNIEVLFGGLLLDCDPNNPPFDANTGVTRSCVESNFLDGALSVGAESAFDGVSFHAYDFYYEENGIGWYANSNWASSWDTTGPVLLAKANYIKGILSNRNVTGKYLVATEDALFCGPNRPDAPIYTICISEEHERVKSYYLAQTLAIAKAENWKAAIWWSAIGYRHSGLLNDDLSPKPAFNTFQFMATKLTSAQFINTVSLGDNIMAYEFKRDNQILWVLWSKTMEPISIVLPQQPANIWVIGDDGTGVAVPSGILLIVGRAPMIVEY
jgi:hypothetical protein